ncbi:tRNA (adenosine(37)-N6)-dimethylallyltransferase MiaA [Alterisphingorhabdus coralli]|uniref:tRNA dimethylallyltransferase n=1 Tax=Alterisphingorhabdus coralli TaxID=3071408 RepID=A0AA97F4T1_9SPHN|nr:tRNA (adenosine(37)-N6)-dimethylallyltransferase MiaA [Parasphingorhabdus sp. SCSIO 66989]WOE74304.1 tRNA (adenosine(37)-N6)-dimethylallyltransferase MiaA [Parasphingorhabdus sp. SCSIO 66989]
MSIKESSLASDKPPVALIAGPTASGKSGMAVALAQRLKNDGRDAVVINADASQVYRDLAVLSARPDADEMAGIEHRLFGYRDGAEPFSAADWAADARAEIAATHQADTIPILVGGTGMYLRTLLDGIAPVPDIAADVRKEVRDLTTEQAWAALEIEDSVAARELHPNDTSRIQRALEVARQTGRSITDWRKEKAGGISDNISLVPLILLPPRDWLYARCDQRFIAMLDQGAIAEVEALVARELPDTLPVMRAIGVPQIAAWLAGEIDHESMIANGQMETRRYAKRQYTWFSNQSDSAWPRHEGTINVENRDKLVTKLYDMLLT